MTLSLTSSLSPMMDSPDWLLCTGCGSKWINEGRRERLWECRYCYRLFEVEEEKGAYDRSGVSDLPPLQPYVGIHGNNIERNRAGDKVPVDEVRKVQGDYKDGYTGSLVLSVLMHLF